MKIKVPYFPHIPKPSLNLIKKCTSFLLRHIILILSVSSLVVFITIAMMVRADFIAKMKSAPKTTEKDYSYHAPRDTPNPTIPIPSPTDDKVLGTSDYDMDTSDLDLNAPIPTIDFPTIIPLPTATPTPTNTPSFSSSSTSCSGTPTVDNSQVYISSTTSQVNSSVTISIELKDCNNSFAPVNDDLRITLVSGDSNVKINGSSLPTTLTAQNGRLSFSVNSANAGSYTFLITDINRNFTVTTPGYHNPSVTFTNNSAGNSNCTTAAGVPNAWYSDVYPNPPVSTNTGSMTLVVYIRDCNKNNVSTTETLTISLSSGDPNTKVSGSNLPYSLTTQNGQASFTVSSQANGTVTLIVQDTTSSFTVTNTSNNNPSVTFNSSSSSTPTPTPTATIIPDSTDTPTPTPTTTSQTNTPTPTPTITPSETNTPIPTPTSD